VLVRIVLFLCAAIAAAGAAGAQSGGDLPEPCRPKAGAPEETLTALVARKARLVLELAQARKADTAGATTLSKTQKELLELLFRIDCAKAREQSAAAGSALPRSRGAAQAPAPAPAPPPNTLRSVRKLAKPAPVPADQAEGSGADGKIIEVTTYYATNRGLTGKAEPATHVYDSTRGKLTYGRAIVTIPPGHKHGNLEAPGLLWIWSRPDPNQHFTLKKVDNLGLDKTRAEMAAKLATASSKALLVFVHGYNMKFEDAAMRTAQLAHDLNYVGMPFFFSWPSAGRYLGYLEDETNAHYSEGVFDQVLDDLAQLPVNEIYVIAHSMGTRLVSEVLKSRVLSGKSTSRISQLLLAAPDIDADTFNEVIAPKLQQMRGTRTTVYASSNDLALMASKVAHGYPRVGETTGGINVVPGVETIDASRATPIYRALGHSYLTDSFEVLRDIGALLRQKLRAKQRGLPESGTAPRQWYILEPQPAALTSGR
jgi:esterase/lipase superfamily enzyme